MDGQVRTKLVLKIIFYGFVYIYNIFCVFSSIYVIFAGKLSLIGILYIVSSIIQTILIIRNSNMRVDNFKSISMDLILPTISASFLIVLSYMGTMLNWKVVENNTLQLACNIIILLGCLMSLFSTIYLGKYFTVFAEANGLITKGIYKYIRNPIYTGYIMSNVTLAIKYFSAESIVTVAIWLLLIIVRTLEEEKVLQLAFEEEYINYKKTTGRFILKLMN